MIEIKKELAELKQKQGQLATKEDIERIINDALKNNSLQNVISQDQIKCISLLLRKTIKTQVRLIPSKY